MAVPRVAPLRRRIGCKVVALVNDDETTSALRAGLAVLGDELDLRRGNIHQALRYFETEVPGQAIVVDISGVENPQRALDELARVCPPEVAVFVVGDVNDIALYRTLVHDLGVTNYLAKPLTRDAVPRLVLARLSGDRPTQIGVRGGQLVVVCGARGGVGTSSIALNLATELVGTVKGHVALLDLHLQGGSVALMLGARPGPELRLALEEPDRVDSLLLDRAAIEVEPRLKLIAAEQSFKSDLRLSEIGFARVLDLLQQKFNFIIADTPMPLPSAMLRALHLARQVVVVLTPDAVSLHDTQSIRQLVAGVTGSNRVITVLNRSDMKGGLRIDIIEKALGSPLDIVIPELGPRMVEAINAGVPAVQRVRALRRHLVPLVREITGAKPRGGALMWLRRLIGG